MSSIFRRSRFSPSAIARWRTSGATWRKPRCRIQVAPLHEAKTLLEERHRRLMAHGDEATAATATAHRAPGGAAC